MSSPKMTRMFGFFCCACATEASSVSPNANAIDFGFMVDSWLVVSWWTEWKGMKPLVRPVVGGRRARRLDLFSGFDPRCLGNGLVLLARSPDAAKAEVRHAGVVVRSASRARP